MLVTRVVAVTKPLTGATQGRVCLANGLRRDRSIALFPLDLHNLPKTVSQYSYRGTWYNK